MSPEPKPGVLEISPYVGGRSPPHGTGTGFKLSSNESALGASPASISAYAEACGELSAYPEGTAHLLRAAIAEFHGLDPERIVCGNGSDELISLLARAYVRPGDEVLFSQHAFIVYRIAALASSATPVAVPERNFGADVDVMLDAVTPRTRIVYLANPNNPTGSCLSASEIERLHRGIPASALLVLDAAYAEYVLRPDYEAGAQLVSRFDNVVMTRTFSKIYGLAGLRVGWAYCHAGIADCLNRVRGPFNVSIPAQRAAIAALRDRDHVARSIAHNMEWKSWLADNLRIAGLRVDDSEGNFLLLQFRSASDAKSADVFLNERGYVLRPVANYGLPQCLRLTVGSAAANRGVAEALMEFAQQRAA